jgi:WD40 repeat protein/serine/threonine protein kinase
MPPTAATPPAADRNLLLAVLALQMDFVNRDDLIEAMNAWVLEKSKPLGQLLEERGGLAADVRGVLETLVDKHLQRHGGDPTRSLAAVRLGGPMRLDVERIADPDLRASLVELDAEYPPTVPRLIAEDAAPTAPASGATRPAASGNGPSSSGTRFRILRPHARGGLGEVFVARDEELQREVALKEIQGRLADHAPSRARFLLEATITGGLEHPGIVPVYGLGTYPDGRPYYAMRFIRGKSLHEALRQFHEADRQHRQREQRTLELRQLLDRFVDLCNAIGYAHSRGILHRDLKPANVMLGPYGETLVVDWGLAKPVGRSEEASDPNEETLRPDLASGSAPTHGPLGTPGYMSPEQAAGRLDQLGPASDVYSLGATLYHVLTGKMPFEGSDVVTTLTRIQRGEFPRPRETNPNVPPALEAVCLKAMALRPEDRYVTARALAEEVERWLADEPVLAYTEPWTARLSRWVRRNRIALSLVALGLMAALAASALFLWVVARRDNQDLIVEKKQLDQEIATAQQEMARLGREKASLANDIDARRHEARVQSLRQLSQLYSLGKVGEALESLKRYDREFPEGRDLFDAGYLRGLFAPNTRVLDGHTATIRAIHVAEDGQTIATAAEDGTIRTWNLEAGRPESVVRFLPGVIGMVLKADPQGIITIASVQEGLPAARSGEIRQGDQLVSVAHEDREAVSVQGLPVPKVLDLLRGPPGSGVTLRTVRPSTGEARTVALRRAELPQRWGHHVRFSPDGRWLAITDKDGAAVHLVETVAGKLLTGAFTEPEEADGSRVPWASEQSPRVCALAFDPESSRIAVGFTNDYRLFIGELETRNWVRALRGRGQPPFGASWSADGKWAFAGNAAGLGLGAWDVSGGRVAWEPSPSIVSPGEEMQVSEGGDWLIWGGASDTYLVRTRPIHDGESTPYHSLPHATKNVPVYAFSPSGKLLATADDTRIFLWHTSRAQHLRLYETDLGEVRCLAFTLDSRRLIAGVRNHLVLFDLDAENESQPLTFGVGDYVTSAEFDPAGNRLYLAAGDQPAQIKAYDAASGRPVGRTFGPEWPQLADILAMSPDGQRLAVAKRSLGLDALEESTIEIWDIPQRRLLASSKLPVPAGVFDLCFSPDGARLAVARWMGVEQNAHQGAGSLRGLREYPVFLLDGQTGAIVDRLGHPKSACMTRFSPDGQRLITLTGGETGDRITIWDLHRRVPVGRIAVQANVFAVSDDGKWLATAYHGPSYSLFGRPVSFSVYNLETRERVATWQDQTARGRVDITALRFTPDGQRLAAGTVEGHLRVWDWSGKELVAEGRVPGADQGFGVLSLVLDPSGDSLVVSSGRTSSGVFSEDGVVLRWNIATKEFVTLAEREVSPILCGPSRGGTLAVLNPPSGQVTIRDLATGASFVLVPPSPAPGEAPRRAITALALSPDGRYLAVVDDYQTIRLVDRERDEVVHSWPNALDTVEAIRFDPDGRTLRAVGRHAPEAGAARIGMGISWDIESGAERARWQAGSLGSLSQSEVSRYYALAELSSDGRLAAFVENPAQNDKAPSVQLWDMSSGTKRATLRVEGGDVRSFVGVGVDPSTKRITTLSHEGLDEGARGAAAVFVRVWDIASGQTLRRWQVARPTSQLGREEGALRVALSPDGRIAAIGRVGPQVDLWDVASGLKVLTFDLEDGGPIRVLRFSPDGKALVAGTSLKFARLYLAR